MTITPDGGPDDVATRIPMARPHAEQWSYERFHAEYDKVLQACLTARLTIDGLEYAIDKLTELRANLTTIADYNQAGVDIETLRDIMRRARQAPYQTKPLFQEASRALSRATWDHGSAEERIERARSGIAEIAAIAERATDVVERTGVLQVAEPLALLIDALQPGTVLEFPSAAQQPG